MFIVNDFYILIVSFFFVWWQFHRSKHLKVKEYYEKEGKAMVPAWMFPMIWWILKALDATALFLYVHNNQTNLDVNIIAVWVTFEMLAKLWPVLFFDNKWDKAALACSVAVAGTAIATLVLVGVSSANEKWLVFGLFIAVAIWSSFAIVLNLMWVGTKFGIRFARRAAGVRKMDEFPSVPDRRSLTIDE